MISIENNEIKDLIICHFSQKCLMTSLKSLSYVSISYKKYVWLVICFFYLSWNENECDQQICNGQMKNYDGDSEIKIEKNNVLGVFFVLTLRASSTILIKHKNFKDKNRTIILKFDN